MDENRVPNDAPPQDIVDPPVTRDDLRNFWVGLGAAIEWTAMRGRPMSVELYFVQEHKAAEALVAKLSDLPADIAESLVRGVPDSAGGPLVPIPSGIWRQTATCDANDAEQPFRLIGTDYDDVFEGAIYHVQANYSSDKRPTGYRRVQIHSNFILGV
jgi:hypothetical protein